jgi:DNA-binding CsgD family transcriptional regulator
VSTSLFDRAAELDALRGAVEGLAAGRGGVTLIEAPPGFGKTSLCDLAAELAAASGVEVLAARGTELQEQVPFGLARVLLRMPPEELGASPDRGLATIEQLAFVAFERVIGVDGEDARPHLLIVDDAQWADRLSAAFLSHLIPRAEGLPIAFLVAARPDRGAGHGLVDELARAPEKTLLRPGPLDLETTAAVVREVCGGEVAQELIDATFEASGGSPLLVRELARELAAAGPSADVATVRDAAPATVLRAVISRLAHLGAGPAALAEAVAILEGSGSLEVAAELAELDPLAAEEAADALAAAGLLAAAEPLDFAQPLVGAALRAEMGPFARARAHRRAAAVLEEAGAPVETVAAQLLGTRPAGEAETVARLREAAALALARGDATTATRLLERALSEPPPDADRGELLAELAEAEATAGLPAGVDHLTEALGLLHDPARRVSVCTALARTLHRAGRLAESTRVADLGRGKMAPEDPGAADLTAAWVASAILFAQLHGELESRLGPIVQRARAGELPASPSLNGALAAWLAFRDEPAPLIRRLALEAWGANAALALHSIDLLDEEVGLLDAAVAATEARGAVIARSVALHFRGMAELERGNLDEALTDAERALDIHRFGWDPAAWSSRTLTFIHVARDDLGAAAEALAIGEGADVGPPERLLLLEARAALRLAEGRPEEALADALESNRLAREVFGVRNARLFRASTQIPFAASACGQDELARERAAETLALAREAESPRALGEALRASAAAATPDARPALLAEAVAILEASPARLPRARATLELGVAERAAGENDRAQDSLRAALELADEIGAPRLVAEAREQLRALGHRPRRAARSGVDSLTPSERRVADLAAQGLSTPQIAHRLFITRKTVESHLGQAYRKLGISTRTDLAPLLRAEVSQSAG